MTLNIHMETNIAIIDPTPLNAVEGAISTVFEDPNIISITENFDYALYDSRSAMLSAGILKEFTPSFLNIRSFVLEIGPNKIIDLILTDDTGAKIIENIQRFVIMYGTFNKIELLADEDNTYIKLLMIGSDT